MVGMKKKKSYCIGFWWLWWRTGSETKNKKVIHWNYTVASSQIKKWSQSKRRRIENQKGEAAFSPRTTKAFSSKQPGQDVFAVKADGFI